MFIDNLDITKKFGGCFWDTLFILVQDNDEDFILELIMRLPCHSCYKGFLRASKKYDLNCNKEECMRKLWSIRCNIDEKYKDFDNDKKYNEYLVFLLLK
tara:strand:+ start:476 stop:772 length:297 start_codon:yes stop_codon:yes gene_type:complete